MTPSDFNDSDANARDAELLDANLTSENRLSDPDPAYEPPREADDPATPRSRLVLVGLALVALVGLLALIFSGGGDSSASADGITELEFTTEDGATATLAEFTGEPLVVNFFASWCAPCRHELPDLEKVHTEAGGQVRFVGINHDIDESSWRSFLDEVDLTFPTVFQPEQAIWDELEMISHPATAFIAADGEVVFTFSGVLDDELLKELIAEHLQVEV